MKSFIDINSIQDKLIEMYHDLWLDGINTKKQVRHQIKDLLIKRSCPVDLELNQACSTDKEEIETCTKCWDKYLSKS